MPEIIQELLKAIGLLPDSIRLMGLLVIVFLIAFIVLVQQEKLLKSVPGLLRTKLTRNQFFIWIMSVTSGCILIILALLILSFLVSRGLLPPAQTPSPTQAPLVTSSPESVPTVAEATAAAPIGASPSQPTSTPTPVCPEMPMVSGEMLPIPSEEIAIENAANIAELAFWEDYSSRLTEGMEFDPMSRVLVAASKDGMVRLWRVEDGKQVGVFPAQAAAITDLDISPNGRLLATSSRDTSSRIWFLTEDRIELKNALDVDDEYTVDSIAFSSDGKLAATGDGKNRIILWLVASGSVITSASWGGQDSDQQQPVFKVASIDFAPDGTLLAAGSSDGSLHMWQLLARDTPALQARWERIPREDLSAVTDISFSPTSKFIAAAYASGPVRVWDSESGQQIARIDTEDPIADLIFNHDGSLLIGLGQKGVVAIWRTTDFGEAYSFRPTDMAAGIAMSADDLILAVGTDRGISLWGIPPCQ
jgi:hypothetical protein